MKDILVLLVLLNAQTIKVCSQPYQAFSNGSCLNSTTDYLLDGSNLCCKKCPPGHRQKEECSETTDTVCEKCPKDQYMEKWNYSPNCFTCVKCKAAKGLNILQTCSTTTKSTCVCQGGMYCIMGYDGSHCTECSKYRLCKAGYGVSVPGKANSNVKCEQCPSGTFSDTVSYTDPCRNHTKCDGRVVVRQGDATSDTVCEVPAFISHTQPQTPTKEPHTEIVFAHASTRMRTISPTSDSKAPRGPTDSTAPISHLPSVSGAAFNLSTKSLPPSPVSDSKLGVVIAVVIVSILLFIAVILLCLCKPIWKKEPETFHPKVDANGNCESGVKMNQGYLGEIQQTSFTVTSPEQQCLLEKGEACSDQSQSSNNTETLTGTDGCSSFESIGPLQPTKALHNPHSALSEPMTLLSNAEPFTPQPSISMQPSSQSSSQPSSQPTSPQIISPVTTSPHVNVNITFHIGNGSAGTPSVLPADLMQVDSKLRFGEEEESFSIPQQEAGKQSLMSVQESTAYCA